MRSAAVSAYIASYPAPVQKKLEEMRALIRAEAPDAEERISYRLPAYFLNGPLVYFGAFSKPIGFYPTSSGIAAFEGELTKYKHSKGAVQFPLDKPLTVALIKRMVRFRVKENLGKK
jgi:uncharacterized protein YdhG (YjbR/CyaY superfamily)